MDRRFDDRRIAVGESQAPRGRRRRRGRFEAEVAIDRRRQQARRLAVLEDLDQRMPIVERIEAILSLGATRSSMRAGNTPPPSRQQFAVVAIGQNLIAEKEDQAAPLLEIGFQQAGFAGGELPDVVEKDAVIVGQIALDQPAFGNDLGLDQRGRSAWP